MRFYSTRQVSKILKVRPNTINVAIWNNVFDPPEKGPGGAYLWQKRDVERAAWAMHRTREFKNWKRKRKEKKMSDFSYFMEVAKERANSEKISIVDAMKVVAQENPELYEQHIEQAAKRERQYRERKF